MLLNEQKNENSHTCYFDSSNVLACKYRRDTNQLAVIFKGGTQYIYDNIIPYTYQRFKVAKSQGVALNKFIRNKFPCTKVAEEIDLTEIYATIKQLKEEMK